MNAGDASSRGLTPEQELLIEGCRSYLDVIHATNAFQVRVCNTARDVLSDASTRISTITNPVKLSPVYTFVDPTGADPNFDGSEAWIGAGIWLDRPVSANLYLAFVFYHDPNGGQQTTNVCFALEVYNRDNLEGLRTVFSRYNDCMIYNSRDWRAVVLQRPLQLGNPLNVREEFETILDSALTWWDTNSNNATANDSNDEGAEIDG